MVPLLMVPGLPIHSQVILEVLLCRRQDQPVLSDQDPPLRLQDTHQLVLTVVLDIPRDLQMAQGPQPTVLPALSITLDPPQTHLEDLATPLKVSDFLSCGLSCGFP